MVFILLATQEELSIWVDCFHFHCASNCLMVFLVVQARFIDLLLILLLPIYSKVLALLQVRLAILVPSLVLGVG